MISMGMEKVRNCHKDGSGDFPLNTTSGTMSMRRLKSLCGRGRKLTTNKQYIRFFKYDLFFTLFVFWNVVPESMVINAVADCLVHGCPSGFNFSFLF